MQPDRKPRKPLLEIHLQVACSQILQLDGWRYFKMEPISRREWGKGTGEKGQCDGLYIRYLDRALIECPKRNGGRITVVLKRPAAEVLWVEWKRPGGKPKPHQIAWQQAERLRGALVLCAGVDFPADFDSFCAFYRASGLMRRGGI